MMRKKILLRYCSRQLARKQQPLIGVKGICNDGLLLSPPTATAQAAASELSASRMEAHMYMRSLSFSSLAMTEEEIIEFKKKGGGDDKIKAELWKDAGFLTKSLYRTCLRSVNLIRPGNEKDEIEFQEREKKRKEQEESFASGKEDDVASMGLFSMIPPVDREDELRSRAEYYHQYARENLVQETDCLPLLKESIGHLQEQDVQRFIFLLKKGEKERRWLLEDMGFPDPYRDRFPKLKEQIQQFEEKSTKYIQKSATVRNQGVPVGGEDQHQNDDDYYYYYDGDEEDGDEDVPQWLKDKYPHLVPPRPSR